uniref:Uncharacterized protein n=1 Tax=Plectus sambesii TaxID=2011161 RepID=A0A914W6D7_9BILA
MDKETYPLMNKLSNGSKKQQNKDTQLHNMNSQIGTQVGEVCLNLMNMHSNEMDMVFLNQMKRLSNGTEKLLIKDLQLPNIILDSCMIMAEELHSQMKKLSRGTEKLQNKDVELRNIAWEICIGMVKICLNQMKKLSNGTQTQ